MLVLDTDHASALSHPSQASLNLLARIRDSGDDAATTIVTVEEQLRGWLAEIHRHADTHRQIAAYDRLQRLLEFFAAWTVTRNAADFPGARPPFPELAGVSQPD